MWPACRSTGGAALWNLSDGNCSGCAIGDSNPCGLDHVLATGAHRIEPEASACRSHHHPHELRDIGQVFGVGTEEWRRRASTQTEPRSALPFESEYPVQPTWVCLALVLVSRLGLPAWGACAAARRSEGRVRCVQGPSAAHRWRCIQREHQGCDLIDAKTSCSIVAFSDRTWVSIY